MFNTILGFFLGLLFAIFFPEPFMKFKGWTLELVKKAKEL